MIEVLEAGSHKRLSASSASRWIPCPASANLQQHEASEPAAEGTVAHEVAVRIYEGDVTPEMAEFLAIFSVDDFIFRISKEMFDYCVEYVRFCGSLATSYCETAVEVNLTESLTAMVDPDTGGKADYMVYEPGDQHLQVVDFKYGMMQIEAEDNTQLKMYALGAMLAIDKPVSKVTVHIYQPRGEGEVVRSSSFHPANLLEYRAIIRMAAELSRDPEPPFAAGNHCRWCTHAVECDTFKAASIMVVPVKAVVPADMDKFVELANQVPMIKLMVKEVEDRVNKLVKAGKGGALPYKLVRSKTHRKWTSEQAAVVFLNSRIKDGTKPITPAQAEKKLDKDGKKELQSLITKPKGAIVVAPDSDSRPAVKQVTAEDFEKG